MWDIGGGGFYSMNIENAGLPHIANISLDEPKLEAVFFYPEGNVSI